MGNGLAIMTGHLIDRTGTSLLTTTTLRGARSPAGPLADFTINGALVLVTEASLLERGFAIAGDAILLDDSSFAGHFTNLTIDAYTRLRALAPGTPGSHFAGLFLARSGLALLLLPGARARNTTGHGVGHNSTGAEPGTGATALAAGRPFGPL